MKFQGRNFQSWSEFSLEISGLTVVTGASNKGKSALFRALKGLFRNELAANYVRTGQKQPLSLTLDLDGHKVEATRARDGSSHYVIDGKQFAKLAGAIPDDIKKLGYGEFKVGEFTVDPVFSVQNEPQFLLDRKAYSPGMLNAILGAFGGTEKLELGKKEANLRITQKNSEAKTLSFEIAEANARIAALDELAQAANQIATEIHSLESSARRLESRAAWMTLTHQRRARYAKFTEILNTLAVPDTSEVVRLQIQLACLQTVGPAQYRVQALTYIERVLGDLSGRWGDFVRLYKKVRTLQDITPLLESRDASTATADARELNAIIGRIEDTHSEANRILASIRLIAQAEQLRARVEVLRHERLHVETQQDAATKVKCPQCGTEF